MFATLGYYICVPFAFLTRLFYSWTGSYGVALILFTLVVKLVLLPFQLKSKKSMLRMNRMQGKLNDIKTRYANNQQKQQEAMAELYAKEGINPMSGCLWSFIPFPILIALYYIIRVPQYKTAGAAAMDLCACMEEDVTLAPGQRMGIPTGIAIALPSPDYVALVFVRSGMGFRNGIGLSNGVGVIDSDYRGEISVGLVNLSGEDYTIRPGDRIAQLMVVPVVRPVLVQAEELDETDRGAGGFGSTGR